MPAQLDILALEPYFGGQRKTMLETLIRCSRHRWTLLKLPPRRIDRRLAVSAHWFAEHLALHETGKVDLVFASDAINLADLYRLTPALEGKPAVAYFHANQLPPPGSADDVTIPAGPAIVGHLATAVTAREIWFNSAYHQKSFFQRAAALLERQVQNFSRSPLVELSRKCRIMPPPTDLNLAGRLHAAAPVERDPRTIFLDLREADVQLLNDGLAKLAQRREPFKLITVGPQYGLSPDLAAMSVPEGDESVVVRAMLQSGVYLSGRIDAVWDQRLAVALSAGAWPIVPTSGVYPELIPKSLNERCMYECNPTELADTLQDFWELELPAGHQESLRAALRPLSAITAAKAMDDRLAELK
jgi:Domain of unknown function (DUF3524)